MNKVFLNQDNIIEGVYDGDQTIELVKEFVDDCQRLTQELRQKNISIKFLFDFQNFGKTTVKTNNYAGSRLREMHYDKMAGFGAKPFVRYLTNFIAMATGKSATTQNFKTRAEAEAWLKK